MNSEFNLIISTVGYGISTIVILVFAFFVFLQKPRIKLYTLWFLCSVSIVLYQLSYIIGANISASNPISYWVWYSNVIENVLTGAFLFHFFTLAAGGEDKFKKLINAMYFIGTIIITLAVFYPKSFVINVSPKLYLLSYINETGPLYFTAVFYLFISGLLAFYVLFFMRRLSGVEGKKRIDYFITALFIGLGLSLTGFAIDFNLPIDPGISALLGLLIIPFVLGMMKKDLMNIRIIIRRASFVISLIIILAVVFVAISFLNDWIIIYLPNFKSWMASLFVLVFLFALAFLYYLKEKEKDKLQYEFITTIAHKFRTPLTRIRWYTNDLLSSNEVPKEGKEVLNRINNSTIELIQLSNLLIGASSEQNEKYRYLYKKVDLSNLIEKVLVSFNQEINEKKINLSIKIENNLFIFVDEEKVISAIHVFLENAIKYSKESGHITLNAFKEKDTIWFSLTDDGIGLSDEEQSHVFSRFYRSSSARLSHVEGVGLGLFMAKRIIERHGGSVGVKSEGKDKGSTFWFTLPISLL